MSKHTPGPWGHLNRQGVEATSRTEIYGADGEALGVLSWYQNETDVGQGADKTHGGANARLIAAAPDLLAGLEDALEFAAEALDMMEPGRTPYGPRFDRWRAAIARAKGGT